MKLFGSFLNERIKSFANFVTWVMSRCSSVMVAVTVFVLLLLISFWLALFLHLILVQVFLPTQSFSWPVHFEFENCRDRPGLCSDPLGVVPLAADTDLRNHCTFPPHNHGERKKSGKEDPGNVVCQGAPRGPPSPIFARGQSYSIDVELVLPDSPTNRDVGMFMVQVSLLDGKSGAVSSRRRPVLTPYRSALQRLSATALRLPLLLLTHSFPETHTVRVPLYEGHVDDPARPALFLAVRLSSRHVHVAGAFVHVHAAFTGLRYLLHSHPVLCGVCGTLLNMALMITAVAVLWLRRVDSATPLKTTSPKRQAAPHLHCRSDRSDLHGKSSVHNLHCRPGKNNLQDKKPVDDLNTRRDVTSSPAAQTGSGVEDKSTNSVGDLDGELGDGALGGGALGDGVLKDGALRDGVLGDRIEHRRLIESVDLEDVGPAPTSGPGTSNMKPDFETQNNCRSEEESSGPQARDDDGSTGLRKRITHHFDVDISSGHQIESMDPGKAPIKFPDEVIISPKVPTLVNLASMAASSVHECFDNPESPATPEPLVGRETSDGERDSTAPSTPSLSSGSGQSSVGDFTVLGATELN